MPTNILMPALSPTMEKGNPCQVARRKRATRSSRGDVIAEIETDKRDRWRSRRSTRARWHKIVVAKARAPQDACAVATMESAICGGSEEATGDRRVMSKERRGAWTCEAVDEANAKIWCRGPRSPATTSSQGGDGEDAKAAEHRRRQPASEQPKGYRTRPQRRQPPRCRPPRRRGRAASQRPRPHFLFAAGPASGQGSRHRARAHQRLRPAWPRHRARRRGGQIRQGTEGTGRGPAGRARAGAVDVGQADPRAVRTGQLRDRAA